MNESNIRIQVAASPVDLLLVNVFFTCCVKADILRWPDHSWNSHSEVSNRLNEIEISTPSLRTVGGNRFRKTVITKAEANIVFEEHLY